MLDFPKSGTPQGVLMERLEAAREYDADWRSGKTWSLVYNAGQDVLDVMKEAYARFMCENALNPMAFPSLQKFEKEVVSMTAHLFHGDDEVVGNMTSGGTESLLMAVKTAREWAKANRPDVREPELLLPETAHPGLLKACHYFGVKPVFIPVDEALKANVSAAADLISPNTIMVVGSAPSYPHGIVDPIEELAALAQKAGILCHVDACLGGYLLPFAERLGRAIPVWDFRVPGVTSVSADLHKYGYAAKGASLVLYRNRELRRHQFYCYTEWPGGLYASPTMLGTRGGGAIAAAWAVLNYLGEEGYLRLAKETLQTADLLKQGIREIPELQILGDPQLSIWSFTSDSMDVFTLAQHMEERGWKLDRQQLPPSLHMMVTPAHQVIVQPFLEDLRACVEGGRESQAAPEGAAAIYGSLSTLSDRSMVQEFLRDFLDGMV